jgi:alkylhydroperoxidase/carboxymuconolactone decarboxylase family protein YurZ
MAAVASLENAAVADLSPISREVGLSIAFSCKGRKSWAEHHGKRALAAGVTRPEVVEALLAGVVHAGPTVLRDGAWIADQAEPAPWIGNRHMVSAEPDIDLVLRRSERVFGGTLPTWMTFLADEDPGMLWDYFVVRGEGTEGGAVPRKDKHLMVILLSCVEINPVSVDAHARWAIAHGATRGEVLAAVRASVVAGGMTAVSTGIEAVAKVFVGGATNR